ncbi:tRNA(Ile)-lysidine synthetase [Mesobacillus campisalis]|uniref:tRNA(Ile)-lysidine synthase n=1 Tax=Mesobacillus campisalis TaxID=1408103 RepID=A0A0M2SUI3_9BACI|nr:tRNA lysidine(34) synthetase TilS [Mesobacillus campisalis]KKK36652.1 tRNA(Ile)-lysidine synthetase [Mesobacillus campisalis]
MIEQKVKSFLERHSFPLKGKRIAVGVSGGPDSLALLHFLWEWQEHFDLHLMALHMDHMFRGEESYQEALFVQNFCQERNIPFEMFRSNVPRYIKETGKNPQLAARERRYSFFEEMIIKHDLQCLALGHHGDDQIETVLMRLTRGSTGKARAGIPFTRKLGKGMIFRPFLCLSRKEIEEYCELHQLEPRRDPSNMKEVYSRNRFRGSVLPFLHQENPLVHEHFQRFSEELESDEHYLAELTGAKMNKVMKKTEEEVTLDIGPFLEMPMPLQRRGIKLILNYLYEEHPSSLSAVHIESIFSIIRNPHPSGTLDFPNGLKITRSYGNCFFQLHPAEWKPFYVELHGPGLVQLPGGGRIEAFWQSEPFDPVDTGSFLVDVRETGFPLIVRTRKPGDRMTLKGMAGTKKLKDIFIDKKIPVSERDRWPVVTDRNGRILWLPGLKKSSHLPDGAETEEVIKLIYRQ